MGSSLKFTAGAATSLASLLTAKYLEFQGLYTSYLSLLALVLIAVIPGVIGGSFIISAASAATGGIIGIMLWLSFFYIPLGEGVFSFFKPLGIDPTIGFLLMLLLSFVIAGAVGSIAAPLKVEQGPEAALEEGARAEEGVEERRKVNEEPLIEEVLEEAGRPESTPTPTGLDEEVYIICKYCSEPFPEGATFCPHCGRRQR